MSRNRVWVLVALVCALVGVPAQAYASDGFLGGLEDLVGTRDVSQGVEYEREFIEDYEPEFREVVSEPIRVLPDDATTVDYVNDTMDRFNTVKYGAQEVTYLQMLVRFLGGNSTSLGTTMRNELLLVAIGIVFMWWGVRKAKNIIMNGFRKGKITT